MGSSPAGRATVSIEHAVTLGLRGCADHAVVPWFGRWNDAPATGLARADDDATRSPRHWRSSRRSCMSASSTSRASPSGDRRRGRASGSRSQEQADIVRPMAFNQGFYNLFLALGVFGGLVLVDFASGGAVSAGIGITKFALASMVLAGAVLLATGRRFRRAALLQAAAAGAGAAGERARLAGQPTASRSGAAHQRRRDAGADRRHDHPCVKERSCRPPSACCWRRRRRPWCRC